MGVDLRKRIHMFRDYNYYQHFYYFYELKLKFRQKILKNVSSNKLNHKEFFFYMF